MGTGRLRQRADIGTGCLVGALRLATLPYWVADRRGIRQSTPWSLRLSFGDRSRSEHDGLVRPPRSPLSTVLGHPEVINGISVYPYPTGPPRSYLVPSLGVEITVDGPLGQRVLHTLTWSPRSVVFASGSSPVVPSSWQQVTFAGLRFSAPENWPVNRTQVTPGLGAICGAEKRSPAK